MLDAAAIIGAVDGVAPAGIGSFALDAVQRAATGRAAWQRHDISGGHGGPPASMSA